MRFILLVCILSLVGGCSTSRKKAAGAPKKSSTKVVATPIEGNIGKVFSVNRQSRFVILTYPVGSVPSVGQRLSVYRNGLKVGEVKVSGPQRDTNTAADIIVGEIQTNDEVREN
jgi:hypothetical protein